MIKFSCDLASKGEPLTHTWSEIVGSGHAPLALRADWQQQMRRAHEELGFRYVRFHGVLSDDMGTLIGQSDKLVYSFFNAVQIYDFLVSIGMRPFVEMSFMPSIISSGSDIVFHYKANVTPPRDYGEWSILVSAFVGHLYDRYGAEEISQWFFEIWNEPNLAAFWKGTQADYFKLYETAARAIKEISPALKVGGPATADNAWIEEFLAFCAKSGAPNDFISTHHYPTDAFGKPGDDTTAQLAASHRSVLREEVATTRSQAGDKPLYYTEWSTSSNPFDELHDQPYAAAYIVKTNLEVQPYLQGYSYWTFSDIFEENYFCSDPFHGGFGLLTIHGIPKPAYRAFQLLHGLGTEQFKVTGQHATIDIWVTKVDHAIKIMATNSALPRHPVATETVRVELSGLGPVKSAYVEKIDDEHANAQQAWVAMGRPKVLSVRDVATLEAASALVQEELEVSAGDGLIAFTLTLPPQGTACVTLAIQ